MDDDEDDQYIGDTISTNTNNPQKIFSLENLPAEFVAFLAKNEIDPAIYTVTDLPRYVRLNPDPHLTITPQELECELGTRVEPVPGLEAFCRLDGSTKLRNCQAYVRSLKKSQTCSRVSTYTFFFANHGSTLAKMVDHRYKDGRIFGMDLSSGIAVYALDVQPGDHVLDICCAPGKKNISESVFMTVGDR